MSHTCVIGLGSPHGDDRFGWLVADRLAAEVTRRSIVGVTVRRASTPLQLIDSLDRSNGLPSVERLLLVDACRGGGAPGEMLRLTWPSQSMDRLRGSGSHDFTVWQAIELASQLDLLPRDCQIWCVPGTNVSPAEEPSQSVLAAVPKVVNDVLQVLQR